MIGQIKCHSNQIISQKGTVKIKTVVVYFVNGSMNSTLRLIYHSEQNKLLFKLHATYYVHTFLNDFVLLAHSKGQLRGKMAN